MTAPARRVLGTGSMECRAGSGVGRWPARVVGHRPTAPPRWPFWPPRCRALGHPPATTCCGPDRPNRSDDGSLGPRRLPLGAHRHRRARPRTDRTEAVGLSRPGLRAGPETWRHLSVRRSRRGAVGLSSGMLICSSPRVVSGGLLGLVGAVPGGVGGRATGGAAGAAVVCEGGHGTGEEHERGGDHPRAGQPGADPGEDTRGDQNGCGAADDHQDGGADPGQGGAAAGCAGFTGRWAW